MKKNSISTSLAQSMATKDDDRYRIKRSAVAMVLDSDDLDSASLLMIQRAEHEDDPWSGHMAFPGGRQEAFDATAIDTAKREMLEEVGLNIDIVNTDKAAAGLIGRLSDINLSRRPAISIPMVVSPYVFLVDERPSLTTNHEVADYAWIPLKYFADLSNREDRALVPERLDYLMPCYEYAPKQVVWGLSLRMIDDLLGALGFELPTELFKIVAEKK